MAIEGLNDQETNLLDRALYRLVNGLQADKLWRDYYDGDHRLAFATEKFRSTFGQLFSVFADNLTPAVVDAVADRLQLTGYAQDDKATHQRAMDIWDRNHMDRRAGEVHTEAIRQGNAAVLVWTDDQGKAILYPQRSDMVVVEYDPEVPGRVLLAVKAWRIDRKPDGTGGRTRVNAYLPDRVVKYVTKAASDNQTNDVKATRLEPFPVPGESWPLGHTFGKVPMVPFANNAAVGQYGVSELRDVIPLQDALNKSVADMMVAMEFVAMPQRWATGIEIPTDPETGKTVESWRPGLDRLWSTLATDAHFGEFPQADLGQFLKVQDNFRAEVARVSATPFHYLMLNVGDFPSGEAMKTAEQRFVSKVRDRMAGFGTAWTEVMGLALAAEGLAGVSLEPDWADPQPRSELEHAQALKVKGDLGVPQPILWREMGYTEDEVAEMEAYTEEHRATLADAMSQALNAGM
jgi:hypothetical protein